MQEALKASEPMSAPPEVPAKPSMSVVEATLAHGVSRRLPIGPAHHFEVGEVAWAWVAVANQGPPASLTMHWFRDDQLRSRLELEIGQSPRWRTWSRRTLRKSDLGSWRVEVRDAEGELFHTMRFEVGPRSEDLSAKAHDFDGC